MNVYTKKGDDGTTGMLSGVRVNKDSPYLVLLGHIDEATSCLGLARSQMPEAYAEEIHVLQRRLIQVMGYISSEFGGEIDLAADIDSFEKRIDIFGTLYPKQSGFITPGDDPCSAALDMARTVVRRAERQLAVLDHHGGTPDLLKKYMNRLSDYLYAFARMIEFRTKVTASMSHAVVARGTEKLTFKMCLRIAEEVISKAVTMGVNVVVSLCNSDGAPILTHRMDEAYVISFGLARKKAYTSAMLKMATHELGKLTEKKGPLAGLEDMIEEEIVTLGGGYPIRSGNQVIGAIGISGSTVENDCALAAYGAGLGQMEDKE